MLTPKQEAFCKAIAYDDMGYSDAYRLAYNTEKMTDKTINEKASRLKDEDKISARIKELRAELDTPRVMSAQKRLEWLSEQISDEEVDINAKLKAIDIMNKMQGAYTTKIEGTLDTSVSKLDGILEQLKK